MICASCCVTAISELGIKSVRLSPNGTNLAFFNIRFQYILALHWNLILKSPRFVKKKYFGPNCNSPGKYWLVYCGRIDQLWDSPVTLARRCRVPRPPAPGADTPCHRADCSVPPATAAGIWTLHTTWSVSLESGTGRAGSTGEDRKMENVRQVQFWCSNSV